MADTNTDNDSNTDNNKSTGTDTQTNTNTDIDTITNTDNTRTTALTHYAAKNNKHLLKINFFSHCPKNNLVSASYTVC